MTDFATLVMRVDAKGMIPGEQALDAITAKSAVAETRVTQATTRMAKGMSDVGTSAQRMGPAIQNASYQVGDFAVQVAGGQSAALAFAQQFPQMAGGLGVWGAALGAAVAISAAVIPMLMSITKEARDYEDVLDDLKAAQDSVTSSIELASTPLRQLSDVYGTSAGRVREMALAQVQLNVAVARGALADSVTSLADATQRYTDITSAWRSTSAAAFDAIFRDFGFASDQAAVFVQKLNAINDATSSSMQVQKFEDLVGWLEAAGIELEDMPPEMARAAAALLDVNIRAEELQHLIQEAESSLDPAVQGTWDWADAMAAVNAQLSGAYALINSIGGGMVQRAGIEAANAVLDAGGTALSAEQARRRAEERANTIQRANTAEGFMPAADLDALLAEQDRQWAADDEYMNRLNAVREGEREASRTGRGGGRGGRSDPERERERRRSEGDQIRDMIRTPLEVWQDEQDNLNALLEEGYLTTEEHAKAMGHFAEQYDPLIAATEQWRDTMKDTLFGLLDGTMKWEDALGNILMKFAEMAMMEGFNLLWSGNSAGTGAGGALGSFVGSLLGGGLPSFSGGGHTGDGPRTGGLDGEGGFLAMMHPRETVQDHTKGGGGSSNIHVTVGIDESGHLNVRKIAQSEAVSAASGVSARVPTMIDSHATNSRRRNR